MGRTSIYAKTTVAEISIAVLRKAGLDGLLAPDSSTPQKLIEDMSSTELPNGFSEFSEELKERAIFRALTAAQRGLFVGEYGSALGAMMQRDGVNNSYRDLIRMFDDGISRYEYATISRGNNVVIKPYLSMLVILTPADLKPFAKKGASLWSDGFLARIALVTPPESDMEFGRFPNE